MFVKNHLNVEKMAATEDGAKNAGLRWVLGPQDKVANFSLRVVEVDLEGMTMNHKHDYEHEIFVLEGTGSLVGESNELPLNKGDAAYVAPNEQHQFRNAGEGVFKFICVIPLLD